MWEYIWTRIISSYILFCAALSMAVPWLLHKIHQSLRKHGDPPWKKEKDDGLYD